MRATIEIALAAHAERCRIEQEGMEMSDAPEDVREAQEGRAVTLGESGHFSNIAIIAITGLTGYRVRKLIEKSDYRGGKLNAETLATIYDLWYGREHGYAIDRKAVVRVVQAGTSPNMISRLTGISRRTLQDIVKKETGAES